MESRKSFAALCVGALLLFPLTALADQGRTTSLNASMPAEAALALLGYPKGTPARQLVWQTGLRPQFALTLITDRTSRVFVEMARDTRFIDEEGAIEGSIFLMCYRLDFDSEDAGRAFDALLPSESITLQQAHDTIVQNQASFNKHAGITVSVHQVGGNDWVFWRLFGDAHRTHRCDVANLGPCRDALAAGWNYVRDISRADGFVQRAPANAIPLKDAAEPPQAPGAGVEAASQDAGLLPARDRFAFADAAEPSPFAYIVPAQGPDGRAYWMNEPLHRALDIYRTLDFRGPLASQVDLYNPANPRGAARGAYLLMRTSRRPWALVWRRENDAVKALPQAIFDAWQSTKGLAGDYGWPLGRSQHAVTLRGGPGGYHTVFSYCFEGGFMRYDLADDRVVEQSRVLGADYLRLCGDLP